MSDFLGNLVARSLGRAEVLRPLPRLYGTPLSAPTPEFVGPAGDEDTGRPNPPSALVSETSPATTSALTPGVEPAQRAGVEARIVPEATPRSVTSEGHASIEVRDTAVRPAPQKAFPVSRSVERAARLAETSPSTADRPTVVRASDQAPAHPAAGPAEVRTEIRQSDGGPAAQANAPEGAARTRQEGQSMREAQLLFRVPRRRQPDEERAVSPPSGRATRQPVAMELPIPETPAPPPVSITIGRLEVRVNPPPSRPVPAPKATPAVMSLEEYLRSRGRGGEG